MNGRNKDRLLMGGIGATVLVLGGAIALYVALRDAPSMEVEQPPAATAASASSASSASSAVSGALSAERRAPANSARPASATPAPAAAAAPQAEPAIPLPSLDESDAEVRSSLNEIVGERATSQYLLPERIVRNVVVTLDNLTRDKAFIEQRPIKPIPGRFLTTGGENDPVLAVENYGRYEPFVNTVRNTDARTLVSLYRSLQPLFQQAYEELGHPNDSFNERLLEIIEHLLETPDVAGSIELAQPSLHYEYADEALESLSVGKKLLIRVGPENRAVIKEKLREIRAELV